MTISKKQIRHQQKFTISEVGDKMVDINININVDDRRDQTISNQRESKVKIVTKLSVTQLAYFFRVLYKMKKIKATNQTDIMRFIADAFETDNVSDISSKSLRSKYYKVSENEKAAVRKQLMEIVQFIDDDIA